LLLLMKNTLSGIRPSGKLGTRLGWTRYGQYNYFKSWALFSTFRYICPIGQHLQRDLLVRRTLTDLLGKQPHQIEDSGTRVQPVFKELKLVQIIQRGDQKYL
jgi:hypothetical protein